MSNVAGIGLGIVIGSILSIWSVNRLVDPWATAQVAKDSSRWASMVSPASNNTGISFPYKPISVTRTIPYRRGL